MSTTLTPALVHLRTDGRDEVFSPPREEGRHAKLVSRVLPYSLGSAWYLHTREPAHQRAKHRAPAHDMDRLFAERRITGRDGHTSVTGPLPWRRFHRDGITLLFHMVIPRPVRLWNYQGRHRRPPEPVRAGMRFPEGLVYVGHFTGDVYRMGPRGTLAANLTRPGHR